MDGTLREELESAEPRTGAGGRRISLKRVLEGSRYLILIGVVATLVTSAGAFLWGAYKTVLLLSKLVISRDDAAVLAELVALVDKFLIAAGLYIFSVAMYELFIDDLRLPSWLVVHSFHHLKSLLSSIIILVLATTFLEHVIEWGDPQAILQIGIGTAVVIAALIAFNVFGEKK